VILLFISILSKSITQPSSPRGLKQPVTPSPLGEGGKGDWSGIFLD